MTQKVALPAHKENNRLPLTVNDLTLNWLQEAMVPNLDGAILSDFEATIIGVGAGFMGQLGRVQLSIVAITGNTSGSRSRFLTVRQKL